MDFLNKYFNYTNNSTTYGLTNELICFYIENLFKKDQNNIIVVTSNLYEANKLYNGLSLHTNDVLLFPMDDFITSIAISVSPEFKLSRLDVINNLKAGERKIIITNLMGYLRFLPSKEEKTSLLLNQGQNIKKSDLIEILVKLGYKKESLVTISGEYANRGMLVDLFPIAENKPIRIEYNGNIIEKIKYFDEESQISFTEIVSICKIINK